MHIGLANEGDMSSISRSFDPESWLNEAVVVVRAAGALLRSGPEGALSVRHKGDVDLVTEMDRKSEQLVVERLKSAFPGTGVLAEEGSGHSAEAGDLWILDPLDGTTNYAHGLPVYAVSLALERNGVLELGIIFDPSRDEIFTAFRGGGARMNGTPIRVSEKNSLGSSLLATGFPYDIRESDRNNLRQFAAMARKARGLRRCGAAALDLAYVAAGRFDGYWEEKISVWDVAAGVLLVNEAGGHVTDYTGGRFQIRNDRIVATNGLFHGEVLAVLADADS